MKYIKDSKKRLGNIAFNLIGMMVFIGIWFLLNFVLGELRFPNPIKCIVLMIETINKSAVIDFQGAGNAGFLPHVLVTFQRYIFGTLAGVSLALALLAVCVRYKRILEYLMPVVDILRTIPPLALAPFLLLWFGQTLASIMGIAIFYTFVTIFVSGVEALGRINPVHRNFAKTMGASDNTIAFRIVFPALFPSLIGPIKIAACSSWGLIIIGEQLGAMSGLGRITNAFVSLYETGYLVVVIFWVLLMAMLIELVIVLITNYFTRWMPKMAK